MSSTLNQKIGQFYDASSHLWIDQWGEHMHHGHYGTDGTTRKDRLLAQEDMIEELLRWSNVYTANTIMDLGCGVGGSARYLSLKLGAYVDGVTLSNVQAKLADVFNEKAGLEDKVNIRVEDMLQIQAPLSHYDLIWSMESAEHIPDKQQLMKICYDLLKPGGKLIMATWCCRPPIPPLGPGEKYLLNNICKYYHLPPLCDLNYLSDVAHDAGFKNIEKADWSKAVAPFWSEVIQSALSWKGIRGVVRSGWSTLKGAWALQYMRKGYHLGLIQYGVLQANK